MKEASFSLQPFIPVLHQIDLKITGHVALYSKALAISYTARGRMAEVIVPSQEDMPMRKSALWEETCFEFFIGMSGSPEYWEFNLSPSGHWNVFRFSDYRQNMKEERALGSLPFRVERAMDSLRLDLEMDVGWIVKGDEPIELGISAVIQFRSGEMSYWALCHTGAKPDFHRRDTFIIRL